MRHSAVLLLCALGWVAGCRPGPSNYPYASEPDPRGDEYVIGVADGLSIRVWGNEPLNTDATVRPDGTLTLPLIGEMAAAGKTPTQVKEEVAKALSMYIKDQGAVVTVAVTRTSYQVVVSGNVNNPGVIESPSYLSVSEAIVRAGGPNRFAAANKTVVIRVREDGQIRHIPVQFKEVQAGRRLNQDIVLLRGDRVYVP